MWIVMGTCLLLLIDLICRRIASGQQKRRLPDGRRLGLLFGASGALWGMLRCG
jgi:hypothetical protein